MLMANHGLKIAYFGGPWMVYCMELFDQQQKLRLLRICRQQSVIFSSIDWAVIQVYEDDKPWAKSVFQGGWS